MFKFSKLQKICYFNEYFDYLNVKRKNSYHASKMNLRYLRPVYPMM